jgi:hypothetical protein
MATKRRRLANRQIGIPAGAIGAWLAGHFHRLDAELGIYPHMVSPFDVDAPEPPRWASGSP